jgi:putative transposase
VRHQADEVWSWDITKLRGPERGGYYELFVIIDIYSRYVVAWTVAERDTGELAEAFIADALRSQGIERDQLWLHADRGTSMTSKPVAQLLVDLGVARSHSRPHVSNIGLHTPASVHYGTATEVREQRAVVLDAAYNANPARFRRHRPEPPKLPTIAWINAPSREALIQSA